MGDEDHCHALFLQRAQDLEKPVHIGGGQARSRLVEHEQLRVTGERAGDGDKRAFGPRQTEDARLWIDAAADAFEDFPRHPSG